jgi:hypothetical protein
VNRTTGLNSADDEYRSLLTAIFRECHRILRVEGRLIFSYANRDPDAWVALFLALQDANFAPVGCMVVHSENETDYAKRNVRACTKDFLMELLPRSVPPPVVERFPIAGSTSEDDFLRRIRDGFFQIGRFDDTVARDFIIGLKSAPFLASPSVSRRRAA